MSSCLPTTTPLSPGIVLSSEDCPTTPDEENEMKKTPFREALGLLMWLQVATRPDLTCHDSESNSQLSLAFIGLLNNLTDYNAKKSIYRTGQVTLLCK